MDFRAPAKADPKMLTRLVHQHSVTSMFGSPALLDSLGVTARRPAPRSPR